MKLKLSNNELAALYELLQKMNDKFTCEDMMDKIIHVLLTEIYVKMHKTIVLKKEKYSIKLTAAEAMAFYIATERHNLGFSNFTGNLLNQINNSIHQKFAV